jgi:peroxiredoxin
MTKIVAETTAPDFTLRSLDGKELTLAKLLEKGPVVAAFFKVSCPVCQFTFPFVERLYQRYGSDSVTFVGISQDDAKATKDFAKEYGVTFPMLLDEKSKGYVASNAYGLTNVPTTFFIEPDGTVKTVVMGFEKEPLESIGRALAERKKMAPASLFRAGESVPAHRPG